MDVYILLIAQHSVITVHGSHYSKVLLQAVSSSEVLPSWFYAVISVMKGGFL